MKTYNYAPDTGIFQTESLADESPLEPGVFLIPAYATTIAPPQVTNPEIAVFKDGEWSVEVLPPPPEPEPEPQPEPEPLVELTPAEKLAASGLTVAELKELLRLET
jgi:hypothetical protein